jgi:putative ATP-dependent endonuclease of OLD family
MFGFDAAIRRIRRSGFYIDPMQYDQDLFATTLWIEADFEFPELKDTKKKHATVPSNFAHMRLASAAGLPTVRGKTLSGTQ